MLLLAPTFSWGQHSLTLDEAIERALAHRPELERSAAAVGMLQAESRQAALYPNPGIAAEIEDFGGNYNYSGMEESQTTYSIAQPIDIVGKRSRRSKQKDFEVSAAIWDHQAALLDLKRDVIRAMAEVAAAQESLRVSEEQARLSGNILSSLNAMIEAGKVSPLSGSKAAIEHRQSELSLLQAKRHLSRTLDSLSLLLGGDCVDFDRVEFDLYALVPPGSLEVYQAQIDENPDLARWDAEILAAKQGIVVEKYEAVPDITLMGGYRVYGPHLGPNGQKPHAWVAAIEFPLPVWDRNQGNIDRAYQVLCRMENERATTELNLLDELTTTYEELVNAYEHSIQYKTFILGEADKAFQYSMEGYRQGKFQYLDVLDAQRTLFDVQADYIDVLTQYHERLADLNRLIGM